MTIFFDLIVISLLLVTIVYAWKLNNKLNIIRNHRAELRTNVEAFYDATTKATKAVEDLKKQGQTMCKEIENRIAKANTVSDEIDFLIARASRKVTEVKDTYRDQREKIGSLAEAELIKALRDHEYRQALAG